MRHVTLALRRFCLVVLLLWLCTASADTQQISFHHDGILGTSLDLTVWNASAPEAHAIEETVLREVERLRRILSAYDPASSISKVNGTRDPVRVEQELIDVLEAYAFWHTRSGGAHSGQLGELIAVWKTAQADGRLPRKEDLERATRQALPRIDRELMTVMRMSASALNVDSLGKGYIIGKAVEAARKVNAHAGILLNIGGDMLISPGSSARTMPARVAVADPRAAYENAPPLAQVRIERGAVATSGNYERGYRVSGRSYSHILDPRTGMPADGILSATVVAPDNVTANALATTLCVLTPPEGLALVEQTLGAACLIIDAAGRQYRSLPFAGLEEPLLLAAGEAQTEWPAGYEVEITLTLIKPQRKTHRPYVAVWVEDSTGRPVRTISVWGNERKYLKELPAWWRFARNDSSLVSAVTRATRPPGRYRLMWDGRNDAGRPLPRGTYTIVVEVNREKGTYSKRSAPIACGDAPATAQVPGSAEFEEVQLNYGPRPEQGRQ